MSVTEELNRIEETLDATFDVARKRDEERRGHSRITVYRKALEAVERTAGTAPMRELGEWIRERVREDGEPPAGRDVRQKGADICREAGYEVSTGSWLGA